MVIFVGLMGALQILGAVLVFFVSKSAVHEILAATMFGSGVIAFALGVLVERADRHNELLEQIAKKL